MGKLLFGIFLILLSVEETVRAFSHHFVFSYEEIHMDASGKQYLATLILIVGGIYLIYKAGESKGKQFFGFEHFDDGC